MTTVLERVFSATEEKILRAFLALCYELGPENITLQKVADRAKVVFGTVHYNFASPGKMGLFDSACIYVVQSGYKYLVLEAKKLTPSQNPLRLYLKSLFRWIETEPQIATYLSYYYYLCATKKKIPFENEILFKNGIQRITSLIVEAVGRGVWPAIDNVNELACSIHQIIHGACMGAGTNQDFSNQEKRAWKSIEILMQSHMLRHRRPAIRSRVNA